MIPLKNFPTLRLCLVYLKQPSKFGMGDFFLVSWLGRLLVRPVSKHLAFSGNSAVWQITGICFPGLTVWNESICLLAKRMAMIADGLLCDQNTDYKLQHFSLSFCSLFCVDQITQKDWMFICISCSSWPRWMRVSRLLVRCWNCYVWGDQERP